MRLQLILLSLLAGEAMAGGRASTRVDVYDDPWLTVVVPAVQATWTSERVDVTGRYVTDAITGATHVLAVDGITSATRVKEVRQQAGITVEHRPTAEQAWGVSVQASREPDFRSTSGTLSGRTDLLQRMSTLSVALGASLDVLGMASDPTVAERTATAQLDLGWSQILSRAAVARFEATGAASWCGEGFGCQANPYRFVGLYDEDRFVGAVHERNPDRHALVAAAGRLSHAVGRFAAAHGGYRFYADTWGVIGHTAEVEWRQHALAERLTVEARARGALHRGVSWYAPGYDVDATAPVVPSLRTADRELSGTRSLRLGAGASWTWYDVGPLLRLTVGARADRMWLRYPEHPLPDRAAWVVGGGIDAEL